jgi:outer membrane protein insertion porin family
LFKALRLRGIVSRKKIDDTVFNLQSLGLFSKVEIHTSFEQSNVSERTVIVKVGERDPGSFVVGFGINNDNSTALNVNYRGYLGVNYRNLMGTGRAVSLRGDVNYRSDPSVHFLENRITASYLEPYIWGTKNRGRINLIRDQHTLPGIFVPGTDHAEIFEANTVGLLLERDIARHIKLTFTGYSFSTERTFDRVSGSTIDGQNIAKIGPLVEFDYRDDAFNPSKGSYSYFSLEYSDPIFGSTRNSTQTINFVKTNIATTVYTPLNRSHRVVWANSLRNGYVANVSRRLNSGVPVQEGFFLGSRSTIRGFDGQEPNRIPNQQELGVGPGLPLTDLTQFKIKNDSYYYLIKTELRFPLWKTSPMGDLSGALFYDGGAVLIHQAGVDIPDSYRDTIGFGVRIATPVGPASLDYGLKLDRKRDPNESPGAFHFSIGVF